MNIIRKFPEDMDARTMYKLVKSADIKRMVDAEDSVFEVKSWINYIDEDSTGAEKEVLAIETVDGEVFATISSIFISEFSSLVEFFGNDVGEIKVVSGKSRAGRKFITCTIY